MNQICETFLSVVVVVVPNNFIQIFLNLELKASCIVYSVLYIINRPVK